MNTTAMVDGAVDAAQESVGGFADVADLSVDTLSNDFVWPRPRQGTKEKKDKYTTCTGEMSEVSEEEAHAFAVLEGGWGRMEAAEAAETFSFWARTNLRFPPWLAPFFSRAICGRFNHPAGRGCSTGQSCRFVHRCFLCSDGSHGLFFEPIACGPRRASSSSSASTSTLSLLTGPSPSLGFPPSSSSSATPLAVPGTNEGDSSYLCTTHSALVTLANRRGTTIDGLASGIAGYDIVALHMAVFRGEWADSAADGSSSTEAATTTVDSCTGAVISVPEQWARLWADVTAANPRQVVLVDADNQSHLLDELLCGEKYAAADTVLLLFVVMSKWKTSPKRGMLEEAAAHGQVAGQHARLVLSLGDSKDAADIMLTHHALALSRELPNATSLVVASHDGFASELVRILRASEPGRSVGQLTAFDPASVAEPSVVDGSQSAALATARDLLQVASVSAQPVGGSDGPLAVYEANLGHAFKSRFPEGYTTHRLRKLLEMAIKLGWMVMDGTSKAARYLITARGERAIARSGIDEATNAKSVADLVRNYGGQISFLSLQQLFPDSSEAMIELRVADALNAGTVRRGPYNTLVAEESNVEHSSPARPKGKAVTRTPMRAGLRRLREHPSRLWMWWSTRCARVEGRWPSRLWATSSRRGSAPMYTPRQCWQVCWMSASGREYCASG
ncbi:uncharacterized protein AMSG_00558 [Thecamonas trahens ATCC 50062]|uniref:C3H1-type domain-containing protein n=1 Tax=Thecamonas trahens ATCC 50062 TaxID=461836 RepID=A0A0L0D964_THETB|nr:hypothetical protein AMSG_00558 [Thecamonas trahens ATCC 50062]KNC48780.1 hypothetical protein AMSG_00558 [Thecamonas trahens ATCC 50062]|eukprot:XP_013762831.1 hypothetical protein AMSG_00558 [Thecamonas trahens ATCC 50062]